MHPVTTSLASSRVSPDSARIVSTDSRRASSMNAQVLTTTTSASRTSSVALRPSAPRAAAILSESTAFFGHPSVTRWKRPATHQSVPAPTKRQSASGATRSGGGDLGPAQRTLHQEHQCLLDVRLPAGVAQHDGRVGRYPESLSHLTRVVRGDAVEQVARHDERYVEGLEVVDRGEAVLEPAGVDQHHSADRA